MIDYDKALNRLVLILTKLTNDEKPTVKELAKEFAVCERTIQRDVYQRLAYFPIEKEKSTQELQFIEGFSLRRSSFDAAETQLIYLAMSMLKNNDADVDTMVDNILSKLLVPDFSSPYFVKKELFEVFEPKKEPAQSILEAIDKKRILLISTKYTTLSVKPYKIASFDKYWYLFAECLETQKIKTFPIYSIESVEVTQKSFEIDRSIDEVLDNVHSGWFEDGNSFEVKVLIAKEVADFFTIRKHLSTQEILETHEDGSLIVSFEVSHDEDVDNLIKSWLPHIKVLEPEHFRERIEKELREYLQY